MARFFLVTVWFYVVAMRLCFATPCHSEFALNGSEGQVKNLLVLQRVGVNSRKRSVQANSAGTMPRSRVRRGVPKGKKQKGTQLFPQATKSLERQAEHLLSLAKPPSAQECQQLADKLERSATAAGGGNPSARGGQMLLWAARLRERAARSGGSKLDWVLARETYASVAADARLPETMRKGARARVTEIARRHLGGPTKTSIATRSTSPPAIAPASPSTQRKKATKRSLNKACKGVWLDPGHGGVDSGAAWGKGKKALRESDLVLDLGRRTFKLLNKGKLRGKVWLTREGNETVTLGRRVRMVNKKGGCLFVSLHANSMPTGVRGAKDARGIETYYLDPDKKGYQSRLALSENAAGNSDFDLSKYLLADLTTRSNLQHSRRFALLVQQNVMENLKKTIKKERKSKKGKKAKKPGFRDLGVKRELLYVLFVRMPAVLFEGPFLSNKADRVLWLQPKVRQAMAQGIATAVRQAYSGGS